MTTTTDHDAPDVSTPLPSPVRPLLAPRSIAVVGAMRGHGQAGYEIVHTLRDFGLRARLYPVHDSGRPVCGVPGHRAIAGLPRPVDLLVVATPPGEAPEILRAAGRLGTRHAVLLAATCAERGRELARVARAHGVRLVGPDSFGVLNTDPRVLLNATLTRTPPARGGLALAVQSSAVGAAVLEHVARNGCGVAGFVSLGPGPDGEIADLIDFWRDDALTRAVALYLDPAGPSGAHDCAARMLAACKPVLTVGGAPGPGIVRANGLDELTDAARMLVDQPLPAGNRLAIVGNAGGLASIAASAARAYGFAVPSMPGDCTMDLGAGAGPREMADAVEEVAAGGRADIVLPMIVGSRANVPGAMLTAVADVLDRHPGRTAAAVLIGSSDDPLHVGIRRLPVYRQHDRAIRAMAHTYRYARWRRGARTAVRPAGQD
ncbi:CoA-binding protein [Actinoplanes sp. NPDC049596]|uniref:CoA-binding protein n=1 Tax=unclassified Actinoplanes TaxID=2626549 RepID=UPI00342DF878